MVPPKVGAARRAPSRPAARAAEQAARTRAERAERTRQSTLDTAQRLFTQHGYDATSLQMIADETGVTKAAVYYYFRTKAEILHAIVGASLAAVEAIIDEAATRASRGARARHLIEGYIDLLISTRHVASLKNSDPAVQRELDSSRRVAAVRSRALQVLFGDDPSAEQRAAYLLVLSVPEIMAELHDLGDDEVRDALVTVCLRLQRTRT